MMFDKPSILLPIAMAIAQQKILYNAKTDKATWRYLETMASPWLTVRPGLQERNCAKWHQIYFKYYGFIPSGCIKCWKIMAHPQTVEQVFEVIKAQEKTKIAVEAKVGADIRKFNNLWSAVWYAPWGCSIDVAKEVRKEARAQVYNLGLKPYLKRGCTEMEHFSMQHWNCHSNRWQELYEKFNWGELEGELDELFEPVPYDNVQQPDRSKELVAQQFIDWAHEHGDKTYKAVLKKYPGGFLDPSKPSIEHY
jgi:hypothetical protein